MPYAEHGQQTVPHVVVNVTAMTTDHFVHAAKVAIECVDDVIGRQRQSEAGIPADVCNDQGYPHLLAN